MDSPEVIMARRYVFWRTSNGSPTKGDNRAKNAPVALLRKIGECGFPNTDGGVSFSFFLPQIDWAVSNAVIIIDPDGRELNRHDAAHVVQEAISGVVKDLGGRKPIPPDALILRADKCAVSFFRRPAEDYFLLTTLSVRDLPVARISAFGGAMVSLAHRRSKYPAPAVVSDSSNPVIDAHLRQSNYRTIKVITKGRSTYEATESALDLVHLLRGLWNIAATVGGWSLKFGARRFDPLGVIHTGPFHTLHLPDGTCSADVVWYDPDYAGDQALYEPENGWAKIDRFRVFAIRNMKRLDYARELQQLVIRYAIALDHTDLEVAFLMLWGILENITGTVGANYDETIKRATWCFKDREIARDLLEHMRCYRNQYVHAAKSGGPTQQMAFVLKSFVDEHLLRLIRNDHRVSSIREYAEFFSLPTDVATLATRARLLRKAVRFLNSTKSSTGNESLDAPPKS